MATTSSIKADYSDGRTSPSRSDSPSENSHSPLPTSNTTNNPHRHPGQHLDDADLLALRRQYVHMTARDSAMTSSSSEDLTRLLESNPIHFDLSQHYYGDMDDDDLHFETSPGYDYEADIRDKLKKANEELKHDDTPVELVHPQRVSFDTVVKAVDIYQDPSEYSDTTPRATTHVAPISEEPTSEASETKDEGDRHQYTVPLNDTQPREGPTLLQQLKSVQFHGGALPSDQWGSTRAHSSNKDEKTEEKSSSGMTTTDDESRQTEKTTDKDTPVLVSVGGTFELRSKSDYIAERSQSSTDSEEKTSSTGAVSSAETSKTLPGFKADSDRSGPNRLAPIRPKSSNSTNGSSRSTPNDVFASNRRSTGRAQSAAPSNGTRSNSIQNTSSVDFAARDREFIRKKREELKAAQLKKEEEEKERKKAADRAQEVYNHWVNSKNAERNRIEEEKRLEREEMKAQDAEKDKETKELRLKKYKEWLEKKDQEVMLANEFRKLQAKEDPEESQSPKSQSQRAFNQWLRRKYEQAKEEKRQLRLEERRLRRRQRRSIKRFQLQQDLQLARAFGYN